MFLLCQCEVVFLVVVDVMPSAGGGGRSTDPDGGTFEIFKNGALPPPTDEEHGPH